MFLKKAGMGLCLVFTLLMTACQMGKMGVDGNSFQNSSLFSDDGTNSSDAGRVVINFSIPSAKGMTRSFNDVSYVALQLLATNGASSITRFVTVTNQSVTISVGNVQPGSWIANLQLYDSGTNLLYYGSSSVFKVYAAMTTPVSIVLYPSGGINIGISYFLLENVLMNNQQALNLSNIAMTLVSPDGLYAYAVSENCNSVLIFSRNTATGFLTYQGAAQNNTNGVYSLVRPYHLALSPDGNFLYVSAKSGNAIVVFKRDPGTGSLDHLADYSDNTYLYSISSTKISPDGRFLYASVTGSGYANSSIRLFSRDVDTGLLSFVEYYTNGYNNVKGVYGICMSDISPDGLFLYGAAAFDNSVPVFSINTNTGMLTFITNLKQGIGGVSGISSANQVCVSPDGKFVYVTGGQTLAIFSRNTNTGGITNIGYRNFISGTGSLYGAVFTSDFNYAYTLSYDYNSGVYSNRTLSLFLRDPQTGALSLLDKAELYDSPYNLNNPYSINIGPDNRTIYLGAPDRLIIFRKTQ